MAALRLHGRDRWGTIATDTSEEAPMADTHGEEDPNVAPTHYDIDERFSGFQIGAAAFLGLVALVLGSVLGVVLANN